MWHSYHCEDIRYNDCHYLYLHLNLTSVIERKLFGSFNFSYLKKKTKKNNIIFLLGSIQMSPQAIVRPFYLYEDIQYNPIRL